MRLDMKIALALIIGLFTFWLTSTNVLAQDYVPKWNYEAGTYFGQLSISQNSKFIAAQVYVLPNNDPDLVYHEVHLLDDEKNLIWKYKWGQDDPYVWGVSVSNEGMVAVISTWAVISLRRDNPVFVTLLDRNGKVIMRKKYGRNFTMFSGVSISPDGNYVFLSLDRGNSLLLLDKYGKEIWSDNSEDADWTDPYVAQNGNLIFQNDNTNQLHIFNGQAKEWWNAPSPKGLSRMSANGQHIGILTEMDGFVGGNLNACAIYNASGKLLGKINLIMLDKTDFALSDDGAVFSIIGNGGNDPNYHIERFDGVGSKGITIFSFSQASGKHGGGSPSIEVSSVRLKLQ